MNFLEGLKRLYIILSVVFVVFAAKVGWDDGNLKPAWCQYDQNVVNNGPNCPTVMEFHLKRVGQGGLFAGVAGAALFVIWLTLRWIIIGFFPAAVRKP